MIAGVVIREFAQQPYEPSDGFCAVPTIWLGISYPVSPQKCSSLLQVSSSLSKTNCLTITLIYYSEYHQEIEISSENWGSATADVATTVLCTIYDQNTYKVSSISELAQKVMPSESHMVHTAQKPSDGSYGCCANSLMIQFFSCNFI